MLSRLATVGSLLGFTPTIQIGSQSFSTTSNGAFSFEIGVDSLVGHDDPLCLFDHRSAAHRFG